MRIAFLNRSDPRDKHSWSGTLFYMLGALERHCEKVEILGPAGQGWWTLGRIARQLARVGLRKNIDSVHTVALSQMMGRIFTRRLSRSEADVVFAPVASTEMAFVRTALPIVQYADLTAKLYRNYAARLQGVSAWSLRQAEIVESRALCRADHLVYASEWAARSAIQDYGVPEEKISVIPMGANLDHTPTSEEVAKVRSRRRENQCRLLFVGVDWERKGGGTALAAMRLLRERGVDASLTVVGCTPPHGGNDPHLRIIPFLNKTRREDQRRLIELFMESDFMLFPTRREAFGVVCCEANACALPVIASDGGGVPVRNGVNGILLPVDASDESYANAVQDLLQNPARYMQLAQAGRQAFEAYLNWDSWAESMVGVFRRVLESKSPSLSSRSHSESGSRAVYS